MHLFYSHGLLCAWGDPHTLLLPSSRDFSGVITLVPCSVDLQVALVVSFSIFIIVKRSDAGRIPGSSPLEARRVGQKQLSCTACMFPFLHPDHC